MKKRILSMLLVLVLMATLVPVSASAAVTIYWPVPGHTRLSQGYHANNAIDISDGSINGATVIAAASGTVTHILQLEQIKWENPADFYTMSNFTVKITRNGQTVQYTGCEWTAIEEETRRPLIWLRATLAAKARTEVTGDEAAAE